MATQISQPLIQETKTNTNVFARIWNALIQPADAVTGDDRRKATSLAALLLLFIPLAILTTAVIPINNLINGESFNISIGGIIAIPTIIFAYLVSRTRYFKIAAYLTIAIPVIAVFTASIQVDGRITDGALVFMTLSVILSSLLLTARHTIISGIFVGISILVLIIVSPSETAVNPFISIAYTVVATGVMALVSRIREHNLEALELAQIQLKQEIEKAEQARDRAERSDQVKSAFLASMSHELRTPLNAIINFTRFVSKGTLGPVNEEQIETLDNVTLSGKHLLNLINDVLDMAKIESGSLSLFVSDDVSINEIIGEVSVTGRALLNDKPVEINTDVEKTLPLMR